MNASSPNDGSTASKKPLYIACAALFGAAALFAPARIIYKHNKSVKTATNEVAIVNFTFEPGTITVKSGATIVFSNVDGAAHTVTADDGSSDSALLKPGAKYSLANVTTSFAYHCVIHPTMTGSVVVGG